MSRRRDLEALVRSALYPRLGPLGFRHEGLHFVRTLGEVLQVIELQPSIYGSRCTVNFGLDLAFLAPLAPWVPRPRLGPHAQDCIRWIRLGELMPGKEDRWWSFESAAARRASGEELARLVERQGLAWLESEARPAAFLRYAEARLSRSQSPRRPSGRFEELRLYAAVAAWSGRHADAARVMAACERAWPAERAHLEEARRAFIEATGRKRVPKVLDGFSALASFLESSRTTAPAQGAEARSGRARPAPASASRSGRPRSPRAR